MIEQKLKSGTLKIDNGQITLINNFGKVFTGRLTKTGRIIPKDKRHFFVLFMAYNNYKQL